MAHHDVAGHHSADDEYLVTPEGSTYEHTDAHTGVIVRFIAWLVVSAVVIHVGLWGMYELMVRWADRQEAAATVRYPLAEGRGETLPPVPRLQQSPANEIYDFRRTEDAVLRSYGWQNKAAGVVRIPIAEAMRLTVERGLPARIQEDSAPDPGLIPADSSSGRTMERRRQ